MPNWWFELNSCLSLAQLVREMHQLRRTAGSIPARGPVVVFFATASSSVLIKCLKMLLEFYYTNPFSKLAIESEMPKNPAIQISVAHTCVYAMTHRNVRIHDNLNVT
jgi:hypothetical protein